MSYPIMKSAATLAFVFSILIGLPSMSVAGSEDVVIENAWSRASIGTSRPGAAYMEIRNTGDEPVTVIGLSTELAMMPEIHLTSTNEQGVSSMSPAGNLTISPDQSIMLEPGGLHAMLMKLKRPMVEGESFYLTVLLADGSEIETEVQILSIASRGPEN